MEPTMSVPMGDGNMKDVFAKVMINRTRPAPCTLEVDLYQLVPERERRTHAGPGSTCKPPFMVQNIPYSDMLLVVVHATCPNASDPSVHPMNVIPSEVNYNDSTLNCQKIKYNYRMLRRRPPSCINKHSKEEEIKLCGLGSKLTLNTVLHFSCLVLVLVQWLL